jgi:hypothetical protein
MDGKVRGFANFFKKIKKGHAIEGSRNVFAFWTKGIKPSSKSSC